MGHLSTSERVCTSTPTSSAERSPTLTKRVKANASSIDKKHDSEDSSTESVRDAATSDATATTSSNASASKSTPTAASSSSASSAAAKQAEINDKYIPKNLINLEEYTRNFKGDKVLNWQFKAPLKWDKVIQISLLHLVAVGCLFWYPLRRLNLYTTLWSFFMGGVAGFGVTAGAHRYWTHRSYKANLPLRAILMACFSVAGQNTLYDWVRDHRVHHKYSETDADPHNANRGFFFAHVGWLMMLKHPEVLRRGRQIDMTDVISDPVVQFHQKYFIPLKMLLCFFLPTMVPVYFWGEEWLLAFVQQCIFRYVSSLNFTWSVNSAAHMYGTRPYDKRIMPTENIYVSILAMGEGWHNYHHVFPWDYKAAELGKYSVNFTTMVLDAFNRIGWAWNMKQPSHELVQRTLEKYGDGTHESVQHGEQQPGEVLLGHCHYPEVPDPELEDEAESSSTESSKLDENDNEKNKKKIKKGY